MTESLRVRDSDADTPIFLTLVKAYERPTEITKPEIVAFIAYQAAHMGPEQPMALDSPDPRYLPTAFQRIAVLAAAWNLEYAIPPGVDMRVLDQPNIEDIPAGTIFSEKLTKHHHDTSSERSSGGHPFS